jgi:hypothetical protein
VSRSCAAFYFNVDGKWVFQTDELYPNSPTTLDINKIFAAFTTSTLLSLAVHGVDDDCDFGAEAMQQAKVVAGVADNRRDRLGISKIPNRVNDPQLRPPARQDVPRLVRS